MQVFLDKSYCHCRFSLVLSFVSFHLLFSLTFDRFFLSLPQREKLYVTGQWMTSVLRNPCLLNPILTYELLMWVGKHPWFPHTSKAKFCQLVSKNSKACKYYQLNSFVLESFVAFWGMIDFSIQELTDVYSSLLSITFLMYTSVSSKLLK